MRLTLFDDGSWWLTWNRIPPPPAPPLSSLRALLGALPRAQALGRPGIHSFSDAPIFSSLLPHTIVPTRPLFDLSDFALPATPNTVSSVFVPSNRDALAALAKLATAPIFSSPPLGEPNLTEILAAFMHRPK